ncbi:hypothetical protein FHS86_000423 [Roseimarinus sediminis]
MSNGLLSQYKNDSENYLFAIVFSTPLTGASLQNKSKPNTNPVPS